MNFKLTTLCALMGAISSLNTFADDGVKTLRMRNDVTPAEFSGQIIGKTIGRGIKAVANKAVKIGKHVSAVEVYYVNSENKNEVIQSIGLKGRTSLSTHCHYNSGRYYYKDTYNKKNCINEIATADRRTSDDYPAKFTRVGAIEIGAEKIISSESRTSDAQLTNLSIALFETEHLRFSGLYTQFLRIGYQKENQFNYIDYEVPLTVGGFGYLADVKLDNSGKLKLFFNVEASIGGSIVQFNDEYTYDIFEGYEDSDRKDMHTVIGAKASGSSRAGFRILNRAEIGVIAEGSVMTGSAEWAEGRTGVEAKVRLYRGLNLNLGMNVRKHALDKVLYENSVNLDHKGERVKQYNIGIRGDF